MRVKAGLVCAIACGVAALVLPGIARADIGFQGPAYDDTSGRPTGSKPESKLWWNDGFWWASMFDAGTRDYHIFRLDRRAQSWRDTGVTIDTRNSTRQDVLSVGNKLLVASHKFVETASHDSTPMPADATKLYRFTYNARTNRYSLDGERVIDAQRSETLVIDRDSTGALWATWVQQDPNSGERAVYVKRTDAGCVSGSLNNCQWSGAPPLDANVSSDDISSVIRFDGNKIGVMWTDTSDTSVPATAFLRFAFRVDGPGVGGWTSRTVVSGPKAVDDHINLKADSAGRVYAVTKTKFASAANPGTRLHRRSAGTSGRWSTEVVSNASLGRTRAILLLDQPNNRVRVFEGSESNTAVYMKKSRLNVLSFSTGSRGSRVIQDTGSGVGDPTSTKQNVGNGTQLVVLASNHATKRYWHGYQQVAPCINGTTGNNTLTGTRGNDRLCGRRGNDLLRGLGGNDRLVGGPGSDTLRGHGGKDAFFGQGGRDTIWARDGFRELVNGGTGSDRARVNSTDVRRSIERLF